LISARLWLREATRGSGAQFRLDLVGRRTAVDGVPGDVVSRLVGPQRLLPVESQVLALLEVRTHQSKHYVIGAKRILDSLVALVDRSRPEIRSAGDAHHQHLVSVQGEMRVRSSNNGANRAAAQRIFRGSVAASHNPGQGFLAAAKPESQRDRYI
jgi:hypothetical protein